MREPLSFGCDGAHLSATYDSGDRQNGLLILSGGNEIKIGAHRGMAKLARDVSAIGYPVFRFDRRGIGDSEGENCGFTSSAPDLACAIVAYRKHNPSLEKIVAFGNCDAATALMIHDVSGIDYFVLANPWVIETASGEPGAAAVKAHYIDRLRDPKTWMRMLRGGIDLRKLTRGLLKISKQTSVQPLAESVSNMLARWTKPTTILLASHDATALAFLGEWKSPLFQTARENVNIETVAIESASHSFASDTDYTALRDLLLAKLNSLK